MSLLLLLRSLPGNGFGYYQQIWENDMQLLRQGTASQEVLLGPFVSSTDFKTAQTSLTIAGSDIRIWKSGAVAEVSASGSGTHMAGGRYYANLDATDTDTPGMLEINVAMAGCLPVKGKYYVLSQPVYDALFAASSPAPASQTSVNSRPTLAQIEASTILSKEATVNAVGSVASATLAAVGALGSNTGAGARTVTITAQLSGAPLEGASVRLTKGAETYVGQTNVSGQLTFNVDDGTWVVSITSPGATFGGASLVVDGPETMTYSLTAISITPSAPGGVTGYWLCLGVNGLIESGVNVSMQAVEVPEGSTGLALDTTIRTATSNGSGVAQFTDLVPGARYSAWRGTGSKRYITIPEDASGSLELNSLLGSP